ncbi:hypothetical protein E4K65_19230 [Bradyrhizobium niftali]|uniref:Uncharacterized protein n=1 Tax=Bradyrhizobium niftali TaxID=2560055 RepID=A0A4Y9LV17_9BRAD|nr:hypothetical protein E4K65_19230 [Bradyrhizobium niftali]
MKRDGAPARHNHRLLGLWVPDRRALEARLSGTTPSVWKTAYSRSTIVTFAMPPPSHMVCRP